MPAHDPQMLKGVLGLLLLSMLSTCDNYGYGLVTQLRAAGFEDLAEGTVYPGLTRLEASGLLESHLVRSDSGPARKYYRLTAAGHAELDARRTSWSTSSGPWGPRPRPPRTPQGRAHEHHRPASDRVRHPALRLLARDARRAGVAPSRPAS